MKRFDVYKRVFPDNGSPFDEIKLQQNVTYNEMVTYLTEQHEYQRGLIAVELEPKLSIDYERLSFSVFLPKAEVYYYAVESVFSELGSTLNPNKVHLPTHQLN